MYALIAAGVVVDLYAPPAGIVPGRDVLCGIGAWVDCTATPGVAHGWTYAGGVFAAPVAPTPTLAQQAAAMLAGGCAITSTATPALDGTYACDAESRADVQAELISLLVNNAFTDGAATFAWPDAGGTRHTFTAAQFKALATALGAFVGALKPIAAGGTGTLPAQPSTIA